MRRCIYMLFGLLSALQLKAIPELTIPTVSTCVSDTVKVPIIVNNFSNVGAITINVNYDTSKLTYVKATGPISTPAPVPLGGVIQMTWYSLTPLTLPNGSTLITLYFTADCSDTFTTPLTFDTSSIEITDDVGTPYTPLSLSNGGVSLGGSLPVTWQDCSARIEGGKEVYLEWDFNSNILVDFFQIELKKEDGAFEPIVKHYDSNSEDRFFVQITKPEWGRQEYRIGAKTESQWFYSPVIVVEMPIEFAFFLAEPYPNPFTTKTQTSLWVSSSQKVKVEVYNSLGQLQKVLFDEVLTAEKGLEIILQEAGLANGVYFLLIEGENFKTTKKLVMLR